ncbi:hypothetical protein SH580_03530 [Coraliomargarita algicola]|uniref:PEP-CTERM protein-sorting domain-containing protein n=1 Tax=Coraliomargarita algicola TaxID=3092156 RepID=A0ABZ0RKN7_9BACT|nr:hypothetical protein [Coraliomargarita sp. J2-16]WPJ96776.1 hypothetical protein SH580_03530 [Coraliomargarita sp. J2-16]
MKTIPILGLTLFAATLVNAQTIIFDHDFTDYAGGATDGLGGTTVDGGSATWSVAGFTGKDPEEAPYIYANGDVTRGSAMLAYTFTTGVYELTATLNAGSLSTIGFSVSATVPTNSYYSQQVASFGLRGGSTGEFEFFEGLGTGGGNDGGTLASYGINGQTDGTLRMILDWDDTTNTGSIVGYYTPDGGSEIQIDLDSNTGGINGNTISPGADLLGVGFTSAGGSYETFTLTAIPEPSSFAFLGGLLALGLVTVRRR